jgi:hypothetical protein
VTPIISRGHGVIEVAHSCCFLFQITKEKYIRVHRKEAGKVHLLHETAKDKPSIETHPLELSRHDADIEEHSSKGFSRGAMLFYINQGNRLVERGRASINFLPDVSDEKDPGIRI